MILDFPSPVSVGYVFTAQNGVRYQYDGVKWTTVGSVASQGETGYTGSAGTDGYTGSRGTNGTLGFAGSKGDRGYDGSHGFAGSTGFSGSQGVQGFAGSQGVLGFTGSKGYSGSVGFAGSQGVQGFDGSQGLRGYDGSRGNTGYVGSQGDIGYVGSEGTPGQQGFRGYSGSQGAAGDPGQQGPTGAQGVSVTLQGTKATIADLPAAPVNPNDFAGYAWIVTTGNEPTHLNGALWFWNLETASWNDIGKIVGPQGDPGYIGSKGDQGNIGLTGDQGYTGSTGANGYVGSRGVAGYAGSQGELGYAGSQGNPGYVGSMGDPGYVGSKGDAGYVGSKGDAGYVGSQGVSGYVGSAGAPGADGIGSTSTFWEVTPDVAGCPIYAELTPDHFQAYTQQSHLEINNDATWSIGSNFNGTGLYSLDNTATLYSNSGDVVVRTNGSNYWKFGNDGITTFPGGGFINWNSAYNGTIAAAAFGEDFNVGTIGGLWKFSSTGTLTTPGDILPNVDLTYDLGSPDAQWRSIYVGTGTIFIGGLALGVTGNFVTVDGNPIITINTAGNLTVQGNTDVALGTVVVSDTAPMPFTTGSQWFNTVEARTYIAYNNQWVDANPTLIPTPSTYLDDIEIEDSTIIINGSTLTINTSGTLLVNGEQVSGSGGGDNFITTGTLFGPQVLGFVPPDSAIVFSTTASQGYLMEIALTPPNTNGLNNSEFTGLIGVGKIGNDNTATALVLLTVSATGDNSYWKFDGDGILTLPGGTRIDNSEIRTPSEDNFLIRTHNTSTGNKDWLFNPDGSTSFPNDTILGTGEDPNVYIETSTTATTSTWTFGTNGILTLPAATPIIRGSGTGTDVTIKATTGTNTATWVFSADGGIRLGATQSFVIHTMSGAYASPSNYVSTFEFSDGGIITLPMGSTIGETDTTTIITPPGAQEGQSLVIRPTAGQFTISTDHPDGFVPGESISISVSTQFGASTGTLVYTVTGATSQQLGHATTGTLTFSSQSAQTVTWTVPAQSSMTTFTFDLTGGTGFYEGGGIYPEALPEITVTLDGSAVSENNHIHLVAGNPATTDIYLGDDNQYVKIEKNGGDVVIGASVVGVVTGIADWNGQGGWNLGSYINTATTGGSGTGLTVDVAGGGGYININSITINNPGTGYTVGDVITINNENNLPGQFVISTVTNVSNNWTFSNTGTVTFPDATVQRSAYPTGQQTVFVNAASTTTDIYLTALTGTVIEILPEIGYTVPGETHNVYLPFQFMETNPNIPLGTRITVISRYNGTVNVGGWPAPGFPLLEYGSVDMVYYYDTNYGGNLWWVTSSFSW